MTLDIYSHVIPSVKENSAEEVENALTPTDISVEFHKIGGEKWFDSSHTMNTHDG